MVSLRFNPRNAVRLAVSFSIISLLVTMIMFERLIVGDHSAESDLVQTFTPLVAKPCAINLYGLPRSFESLVLPSLLQNVVKTNIRYECDYFIHYYDLDEEPEGRDGRGGRVEADQIRQLEGRIRAMSPSYQPVIKFDKISDDQFWRKYRPLIDQIWNTNNTDGKPRYLPYNHDSYKHKSTIANIIKMWHGQRAVWNLMESQKHYSRVAMLRNDVLYVTPVDLYQLANGTIDQRNEVATIPYFARYPVNDRYMVGPYDAVRVWAAERFDRLERHADYIQENAPGDGIHSERFLAYTLFPDIRDGGVPIEMDKRLCFLRVRADESVRLADCGYPLATSKQNQEAVEYIIQRPCIRNNIHESRKMIQLECHKGAVGNHTQGFPRVSWDNKVV